jgi:hypothetical protein
MANITTLGKDIAGKFGTGCVWRPVQTRLATALVTVVPVTR